MSTLTTIEKLKAHHKYTREIKYGGNERKKTSGNNWRENMEMNDFFAVCEINEAKQSEIAHIFHKIIDFRCEIWLQLGISEAH